MGKKWLKPNAQVPRVEHKYIFDKQESNSKLICLGQKQTRIGIEPKSWTEMEVDWELSGWSGCAIENDVELCEIKNTFLIIQRKQNKNKASNCKLNSMPWIVILIWLKRNSSWYSNYLQPESKALFIFVTDERRASETADRQADRQLRLWLRLSSFYFFF